MSEGGRELMMEGFIKRNTGGAMRDMLVVYEF